MTSGSQGWTESWFTIKFCSCSTAERGCCSAEVIVGPLAPGNILDWDLTVSDPVATITSSVIQGPLSATIPSSGLSAPI